MVNIASVPTRDRAEAAQPEATRNGLLFSPRVDIFETEDGLTLRAELPGVAPTDVDLRFEKGELVLHGKVAPRPQSGNVLLREYETGDFYRVFRIDETIDAARIEASHRHGVLTVRLPKVEAVRPRQIQVKVS